VVAVLLDSSGEGPSPVHGIGIVKIRVRLFAAAVEITKVVYRTG
jgi:hypothetical protein